MDFTNSAESFADVVSKLVKNNNEKNIKKSR